MDNVGIARTGSGCAMTLRGPAAECQTVSHIIDRFHVQSSTWHEPYFSPMLLFAWIIKSRCLSILKSSCNKFTTQLVGFDILLEWTTLEARLSGYSTTVLATQGISRYRFRGKVQKPSL